jgi:hypothetical protein
MLLDLDFCWTAAPAADAAAQARAPVGTTTGADAVIAVLVAVVAVSESAACDPCTVGPLAPVTLIVEAVACAASLAQAVPRRTSVGRTPAAAGGWTAIARYGRSRTLTDR